MNRVPPFFELPYYYSYSQDDGERAHLCTVFGGKSHSSKMKENIITVCFKNNITYVLSSFELLLPLLSSYSIRRMMENMVAKSHGIKF